VQGKKISARRLSARAHFASFNFLNTPICESGQGQVA
jgi:hypothetical protein